MYVIYNSNYIPRRFERIVLSIALGCACLFPEGVVTVLLGGGSKSLESVLADKERLALALLLGFA